MPGLVTEDAPADPRNVYAATKLAQEHLAAAWARATGGRAGSLRYHNVYGPGMPRDTPYAGVASFFRSAPARGEAPRVFEDGGQLRDFVHVRDVAVANVVALEALAGREPGVLSAFNTSGEPHTVGEMAKALARAHGGPNPRSRASTTGRRTAHHRVLTAPGPRAGLAGGDRLLRGNGGARAQQTARSVTSKARRARQRHRPGLWFTVSRGRLHGFESLEEARLLLALDFVRVAEVLPQLFRLTFEHAGGCAHHTPGFLGIMPDGGRWLFDVRPRRLIEDAVERVQRGRRAGAHRPRCGRGPTSGHC